MDSSKIWGFWGTFLWGIVIGVLLFLGQLIPLLVYMIVVGEVISLENFFLFAQKVETDAWLLSISVIGSALIVVPLVFGIAKLKKGSVLKEYFDLRAYSWKTFWRWMGILVLLLIFEGYAIELMGAEEIPSFMMNIEFPSTFSMYLLAFSVMFMAPLIEEVVFRGFLLKGFSNTFMGAEGAVALTSLLWAIIHLQYEFAYVAVIFMIGLVFGYARIKTQSLFVPMTMHMLMNGVAVVGLFVEKYS